MALLLSIAAAHADPSASGRVRLERAQDPVPQSMLLHDRHHTSLSTLKGPRRGRLRWTTPVGGEIIGSGAISRSGISYWPVKGAFQGQLIALDQDGLIVRRMNLNAGSNSSPVIARDGAVYTTTLAGDLIAFNPEGDEQWRYSTGLEILSSPLVDEAAGQIIFSAEDRTLGINRHTGKLAFMYNARNRQNNSSPTLGPDGLIRITNWGGLAMAITGGGAQAWKTRIGGSRGTFWASPTLGAFGTLYTAGRDGSVVALSPEGRVLWHIQAPGRVNAFLALTPKGHLLVPVIDFGLIAVAPNGEIRWHMAWPSDPLTATLAVDREGAIYFGTYGGSLGALKPGGAPLWRLNLGESFQSGPIIAPPVRGSERMYIGSRDGNVHCVE